MALHVTRVETLQNYELKLVFNNGVTGIADLSNALWEEMFEPLSGSLLLSQNWLNPELGAVNWSNAADLAPEFLYDFIQPISNRDR